MNPEIEELIDEIVIDGTVDPKERKVLYDKAEKLGISQDEVDVVLNAKLYKLENSLSHTMPEFLKKHSRAAFALAFVAVVLILAATVFPSYINRVVTLLIILSAGTFVIFILYKLTRSKALCVMIGIAFCGYFGMELVDLGKDIRYNQNFYNNLNSMEYYAQTTNISQMQGTQAVIYNIKFSTNNFYTKYNEIALNDVLNKNDTAFYSWNKLLYVKGRADVAALENQFKNFAARFPKSKIMKEYSNYVAAQKYAYFKQEEKALYESAIRIKDYDKFAAKYNVFKRNYPNSKYMNELDILMEKKNVEKLKEIQGINND